MWIMAFLKSSARANYLSYMRSFIDCLSKLPNVNWQVRFAFNYEFLVKKKFHISCQISSLYQYVSGLESFSQEQTVLKRFESMATGKILLAEILERQEGPLVVLYDTSQDDDININAACMKALRDKSLESPLKVTKTCLLLQ